MESEIKKIKAIRTISKEEMMKMKRISPYIVDEMVLIGELIRNTDDVDDIIYGKKGLSHEETETLHQE